MKLELGFRGELIVDRLVPAELKSTEDLSLGHRKQVLTHLRLTGLRLGHSINFNVHLIKEGLHRVANNLD
ncbi:GxxExxY protein [Tautonia plasticadhaerens]|uniref:GxxExxY protein n=1 Tax=Tautonia plasticadhaerens TaxID=2527974 RepID=UPI0018D25B4E